MELRQYIAIVWHWLWLLLLGVFLAGGAAFVAGRNTDPVYRSSVHLLINQAPGESGTEFSQIQLSERLARTYRELIQKRPILEETIRRLDLDESAGSLSGRITVAGAQDTQIIIVHVEGTDPHQAALIANTLVEVFIDANQRLQAERYSESIVSWEGALTQAATLVDSLEVEIAALNNPATADDDPRLAQLESQLAQARNNYSQMFSQLQTLRVAQARELNNIVVVEPAAPNFRHVRPNVLNNTLLAAVVGGMLALGVVFAIEYLDDTVKTPEQIAQLTELPTLGAILAIEGEESDQIIVARDQPRAPASEAYRTLRTNLGFTAINGGLYNLAITSPSLGEGKSTTAANIAVVMAQAYQGVILVDADLRRPRQHRLFDVSNNQGLTTAVLDVETPVVRFLQDTAVPGLRVLTSGPLPPNPAEILNSQRMRQIIEALQKEADVVIFDTPPLLSVTDAAILGAQLRGVLLVVEAGRTREGALVQAAQALMRTSAVTLGVVMNRLQLRRGGYYYYYYQQYYHHDYASEKPPRTLKERLLARVRR